MVLLKILKFISDLKVQKRIYAELHINEYKWAYWNTGCINLIFKKKINWEWICVAS